MNVEIKTIDLSSYFNAEPNKKLKDSFGDYMRALNISRRLNKVKYILKELKSNH